MISKDAKYKKEVGDRFLAIRESLESNQTEMGKLLNVSYAIISQIENGHRLPTIDMAIELHSRHDVSMDYLFSGRGNKFKGEGDDPVKTVFQLLGTRDDFAYEVLKTMIKSKLFQVGVLTFSKSFLDKNKELIQSELDLFQNY